MADKTLRGRFVWHELMTPDSVAAYGFYAKALGWKTATHEGDSTHTSFATPSGPLGGATQQDEGAPNWVPYIGTTDLEQTLSDATDQGATVTKSITTIGGGGRYAVLTDPQGATFGVYASSDKPAREAPAKRGEHSWHELATSDAEAAVEFYTALFGWEKMAEHDMGPGGMYYLLGRNGRQLIGIYKMMDGQPGPAWLAYVRVKDVEKSVKKVTSAGGKLINGPMDVPGGDRIAQFLDPQGAMFAVHALAVDLQPPAPKPAAAPAETPAAAEAEEEEAAPEAMSAKAPKPAAKKAAAKKSAAKKPAAKKAPVKVATKAKTPARKVAKASKKAAKKSVKKAAKKAKTKAPKKAAKKKASKKGKTARKAK